MMNDKEFLRRMETLFANMDNEEEETDQGANDESATWAGDLFADMERERLEQRMFDSPDAITGMIECICNGLVARYGKGWGGLMLLSGYLFLSIGFILPDAGKGWLIRRWLTVGAWLVLR